MDIVYERPSLPYRGALRALADCCASTARVYRETIADRGATLDPCVLVVEFRLRAVRGWGHAAAGRACSTPRCSPVPRVRIEAVAG